MAGSAPRIAGGLGVRVPIKVGLVVHPVALVQFTRPSFRLLDGSLDGQVPHQRFDLGAQKVVGAEVPNSVRRGCSVWARKSKTASSLK